MSRSSWLAVAAVLAIFAMHGLATHAAAHAPASSTTATEHAHHAGTPAVADSSTAGDAAPAHGEPGHEMSALELCLAVLATAAVLLLRAVRPRSGLLALLPFAVTTATGPVVVRPHAPPDLHALSVLRC